MLLPEQAFALIRINDVAADGGRATQPGR